MKILAIDSSGMTASAAIAEEGKLIAEYSVNNKKTHSQTLLPMIDEIFRMAQLDRESIDAVAAAAGPGSFTGLRIGAATAKGIGLALNKPLISVPTLEAMAYNAWGMQGLIVPMMDARREQVYTGIYRFDGEKITAVMGQDALSVEELMSRLNERGEQAFLLGDGTTVFRDKIREALRIPYVFAPAHMNQQRAGAVACCAFVYAARGELTAAADFRPDYLRLSQAERVRAEQTGEAGNA